MSYRVVRSKEFEKALLKIDRAWAKKINAFLDTRIDGCDDPFRFGKALTGGSVGLWRYRVGGYRAIVRIDDKTLVVLAVHAGNRKDVYR